MTWGSPRIGGRQTTRVVGTDPYRPAGVSKVDGRGASRESIPALRRICSFSLFQSSGPGPKSRSAKATAWVSDAGEFLEYHSAVFAGQPAEEGTGYTDAQLTQFANTAGIAGAGLTTWQQCTSSSHYATYVADVQTNGEKAGVFDTVALNGKNITTDLSTPDALAVLVKAATN